jgi:hypothetical protein
VWFDDLNLWRQRVFGRPETVAAITPPSAPPAADHGL